MDTIIYLSTVLIFLRSCNYVGTKNNYLKTSYFGLPGWRNDGLSISSSWPTWSCQSKKRSSKHWIWKIRRISYSTYTFARVSTNNKHLIQLVSNLLHLPQKSFRFPPPRYKGARLNSATRINFTNLYYLSIFFHHTFWTFFQCYIAVPWYNFTQIPTFVYIKITNIFNKLPWW